MIGGRAYVTDINPVNNNEITITKIINDKDMEYYNREDMDKSITELFGAGIHEEKLCSNPFPVNQLKEELDKLKQKKMKTKKFYHTFDFQGREITLLLHVKEEKGIYIVGNTTTVDLTYSVRLHEDEEIEGLTKKIAIGRLKKGKILDSFIVATRFAFKLAYLKGLAFCFENEIKRGDLEIVGVTNGVAKEMKNEREQAFQETNENLEEYHD